MPFTPATACSLPSRTASVRAQPSPPPPSLPHLCPRQGRGAARPDGGGPQRTGAALRGRGLPCALFPGPPPLPAPTASSEPAALPPCPALLSSGATPALPLRSGLGRAAPRGAGEAGAGRGRPFPPPREEVTWRRRGGKARGALFFPEPPGGWSLAAPPEPAASRRVQTSGSWCGSAAAPPRQPPRRPPAPGASARHACQGPAAPGTCSSPGDRRAPQVYGRPSPAGVLPHLEKKPQPTPKPQHNRRPPGVL